MVTGVRMSRKAEMLERGNWNLHDGFTMEAYSRTATNGVKQEILCLPNRSAWQLIGDGHPPFVDKSIFVVMREANRRGSYDAAGKV